MNASRYGISSASPPPQAAPCANIIICPNLLSWYAALSEIGPAIRNPAAVPVPLLGSQKNVLANIKAFCRHHKIQLASTNPPPSCMSASPVMRRIEKLCRTTKEKGSHHVLERLAMLQHAPESQPLVDTLPLPQTMRDSIAHYRDAGQPLQPQEDIIIACGPSGRYGGALLSLLMQRRLVIARDVEDVVACFPELPCTSVAFAIDNADLTSHAAHNLLSITTERSVPSGFLYCHNPQVALWCAVKAYLLANTAVAVLPDTVVDFCDGYPENPPAYYVRPAVTRAENGARGEWRRQYGVACVLTHSNGIDTYFGGRHALCSRKTARKTRSLSPRYQICYGGAPCRFENRKTQLYRTDLIKSSTLFMCTCYGAMFIDSCCDQSISLSHQLALSSHNSNTLTASSSITGSAEHLLWFYALCSMGMPLGAVAVRLNQWHRDHFKERPKFVLFGDPAHVARTHAVPRLSYEVLSASKEHVQLRVQESPQNSHVACLDLSGIHTAKRARYAFYEAEACSQPVALRGVRGEVHGRDMLYLMAQDPAVLDGLLVHLYAESPYGPYESACRDAMAQHVFWQVFFHQQSRLASRTQPDSTINRTLNAMPSALSDLATACHGLGQCTRQARSLCNQAEAERFVSVLARHVMALHAGLYEYAADMACTCNVVDYCKTWSTFHTSKGQEQEAGHCPYCRAVVHESAHDSILGGPGRRVGRCVRCDLVYDVGSGFFATRIQGDAILNRGTNTTHRVHVVNESAGPAIMDSWLALQSYGIHRRFGLSNRRAFILAPGASTTIDFDLHVKDNLTKGAYVISCNILMNGCLNILRQLVYVH